MSHAHHMHLRLCLQPRPKHGFQAAMDGLLRASGTEKDVAMRPRRSSWRRALLSSSSMRSRQRTPWRQSIVIDIYVYRLYVIDGHLLTVGLVWNKWVNLQFVFTRQVSHPWPFWVKIPDPSSFRSLRAWEPWFATNSGTMAEAAIAVLNGAVDMAGVRARATSPTTPTRSACRGSCARSWRGTIRSSPP